MQDKIIQSILTKVEEEGKQEEDRQHTLGVYRASEIGGCPRALQYATLQYKGEVPDAGTLLLFKDGHLHHNAVRELLAKVGTVSHVEKTMNKKYEHKGQKFIVTGSCDLVFNGMVIDIKSISTFRFKYIDKNYPQDFMNYLEQVRLYMDMLNLDKGAILFKDKNSSELKIKYVSNDEGLLTNILDRLANIHMLTKKKKFISRPYGRDTWHCKLCAFRLQCWKLPMERREWAGVGSAIVKQGAKDARRRQKIAGLVSTITAEGEAV